MKVKLREKSENIKQISEYDEYIVFNKEYTVYGMAIYEKKLFYYICNREDADYPLARSCDLFELLDNRLSRYWIFDNKDYRKIWIFPEWINDTYFQDKLTDWEKKEMAIFKAYKEAMNLEFPDSSISAIAQIGDDQWLRCPICIDAWENSDCRDAIVKCPKCKTKFNNPRYKNEYPHLSHF